MPLSRTINRKCRDEQIHSEFGNFHIVKVVLCRLTGSVLITLFRLFVLVDFRWRICPAHLLLLDNVALLELLQAELHHFLLEVCVLDDVLLAVVWITQQVRSQLVRGIDL